MATRVSTSQIIFTNQGMEIKVIRGQAENRSYISIQEESSYFTLLSELEEQVNTRCHLHLGA